jgi:Fe-S cluster assembly ATP-binding protein
MSRLEVSELRASVAGRDILHGINLSIAAGEVHAVMGPNGAGKSTLSAVMMGKSGYTDVSGSVQLDGRELMGLPTWERALAGLHLVMQYPTEVPGVRLNAVLTEALATRGRSGDDVEALIRREAAAINFDEQFIHRALNVDLSGGEKKRNETLQLGVLAPKFAILDELDSGLDVDALRDCARRVEAATDAGMGALVITHYSRLLDDLRPDHVHILVKGRIVASGGPELADELERDGYAAFSVADEEVAAVANPLRTPFD